LEKQIFLTDWSRKAVDAEWQFLEMAKRHGVLDEVPSEKDHALLVDD
jgi:hypothetical protein